ncbi:MAG TPA: LPS assembly lipoprotein LptE [Anaeromyxobacteraceae bacterium]|nr:LPS assembly lipoprotein LptE [Anaeromyxobacteraceae bacterium]
MLSTGTPGRRAAAAAAALLAGACGYRFTARADLPAGVDRVAVRPFENLSTEPELGAAVAAALRRELARRGAEGEGGAVLTGEVRATEPVPSTPGAVTWRIAIEVRARLAVAGAPGPERTLRRETDYLAGVDALETEGRRALALRRLADEAARDLVAELGR